MVGILPGWPSILNSFRQFEEGERLFLNLLFLKNKIILPQPVWLSWLGVVLKGRRTLVRFLVAWVASSVPSQGANKRHMTDISLSHPYFSPSLSLSLSKIKN